jgi:CRP-like cAMP-binding protein
MTLLAMSDRDFDAMLDVAVPSVSRRILRVLSEHLRRADERVEHTAGAS